LKRAALFLGIASGFFFIANPIYIKHDAHPLMANGRPFASAHFVNGQWAIPLEDFARLGGSNVSLEPNFKLQGNMLIGLLLPAVDKEHKHLEASASSDSVTSVSAGKVAPAPVQQKGAGGIILQNKDAGGIILQAGAFHVTKNGAVISSHIFMFEGKAWIPLADVARAFGGTFTAPAGNLQPGQSMSLNFTRGSGGGVLAMNR